MTFSAFIAQVYGEILNRNTKSLDLVKQATVRQLKMLSSVRTLMMEATATFTASVANPYAGEYVDSTISGFPADAAEIDTLYYQTGTIRYYVDGPVPIERIRFHGGMPAAQLISTPTPDRWAWFSQKLWFAPPLSAAKELKIDYFRDATRDTATGNELTTASTTQTNPWFDRGEVVLRYFVLADYFANPLFLDAAKASACLEQARAQLDALTREYHMKKGSAIQAPGVLGTLSYL